MAQRFKTPITVEGAAAASSQAVAAKVDGDIQNRVQIDAGGKITWGDGSSAGDTNLYRSAANAIKTDDTLEAASGLITLTTTGAPTASLADGAIAIDTTNDELYIRSGGAWVKQGGGGAAQSDTAPSNPVAGDLWYETDTGAMYVYYDSAWIEVGTAGVIAMQTSSTPPTTPSNGDLWFDTDTAKTYLYYDDGSSAQWVEVGAASAAASGTDGAVQFASGGTFSSDASNLVWDDANNRLGIGTTTPAQKLHVKGDNEGIRIEDGGATDHYDIYRNDTTGYLEFTGSQTSFSGYDFEVNNGTNVMRIDNSGRVGIGTTTPTVALHVDSGSTDQYAAPQIYIAPSGHASSDRAAIQLDDIQLLTDIFGNGAEDFSIYSNGAASHRLVIDSSGNVGIGTTSPASALEIADGTAGQIRFEPTPIAIGSNNDGYELNIVGGTPDSYTNAGGRIRLGGGTRGDADIDSIIFMRDTTETMRINSSGNVGIGTTTPSYKLHVRGGSSNDVNPEFVIDGNGSMAFHNGLGTGSYNGIVQAGDKGIIFSDGTQGTGEFVIAPWASGTNGMRINSSGNVGIGQSSPSYRLDVSGPEDTASRVGISSGNTAYRYHMRFARNGSLLSNGIFSDTGAAYFGTPSDVNLKTGISDLSKQDALSAVSALRPVGYRYLLDTEDVVRKGFIAQEMVEVIPEAVHRVGGGHPATSLIYDENGDLVATDVDENGDPIIQQEPDWMVTWEPITTTLVAAVQAQQELIQELTARIEALEAN